MQVIGQARGNRAGNPDVLTVGFNDRTDNLTYRFAEFTTTSYFESGTGGTIAYIPGGTATAGYFALVNLLITCAQSQSQAKTTCGITGDPGRFLVCVNRWDSREQVFSVRFSVLLGTLLVAGTTLSLFGAPQ